MKIQKISRLGLAAGVLWLPVHCQAQSSEVEVYGKLYPQINNYRTSGATAAGTQVSTLAVAPGGANLASSNEIESSDSAFGFRGSEALGDGVRVFWQIESTVAVDTGVGQFAGRNTHIGIAGPMGTLRMGKIDTVYKSIGDTLNFLGVGPRNQVSHNNVISKPGFGNNLASSFHLRRDNSVNYQSPMIGPFQLLAQYSPDEAKTANRNADLQSYGLTYKQDGLYLAVAHEIHRDLFGGSRNSPAALSNFANLAARSKDDATRATAKYAFGASTVEFNYAWKQYQETGGAAGRFESYKNGAWLIGMQHKFDAITVSASYVNSAEGSCTLVGGKLCSTDGLDGQQANLGASYALSKRSYLFLIGTRLNNGKSATYSNLAANTPNTGADITQVALGISHSF